MGTHITFGNYITPLFIIIYFLWILFTPATFNFDLFIKVAGVLLVIDAVLEVIGYRKK
jgi:hypothetical protein